MAGLAVLEGRARTSSDAAAAPAGDLGAWGDGGGGTRAGRAPPPAGEGSRACSGACAEGGGEQRRRELGLHGGEGRRGGVACVCACVCGVEGTGFEVSEGRLPSVMFLPSALYLALGKHANKFN